MIKVTNVNGGGIGFCGLLTILFIFLKLTDKIDWDWIWVLSPMWVGLAVALGIVILAVVIAGIGATIIQLSGRKKR